MIECKAGERKHQIAEEYLAGHSVGPGVFMILVARARATVWKVKRSAAGVITNLEKKTEYVNHYSFHIMDPAWGHMVVKMSGHPPFGAQVILNGHEYVACPRTRRESVSSRRGTALLDHGSARPGPDRRHLVAECGYRAAGPGLRPVDLHRVPVSSAWTWPSSRPAGSGTPTRSTRPSTAGT